MSFFVDSNSLERHKFRKMVNKKNIIRFILIIVVFIFIAGYLYEEYQAKIYLDQVKGNSITVNQVQYNYEIHGKGDYIVIVDSASGSSKLNKEHLMESFDGKARLFFYDRPGFGGTKGVYKTPKEIAEDLHFIFRRFGWKMEFILIGEEYGSLVMQEYLHLYPDEVIGGIFINPVGQMLGKDEMIRYTDMKSASFSSKEILGTVGVPRLMQNMGILDFFDDVNLLDEEDKQFYSNLRLSKSFMSAMRAELSYMKTSESIEVKEGLMGDSPLYLITSNRNSERFMQEKYLSYSSESTVFTVPDSVTDVILEKPHDVVSNLHGLLDKITRSRFRK